jgi:hypothetical protein
MAPPAADIDLVTHTSIGEIHVKSLPSKNSLAEPLKYSGSLDQYKSFDVTKVIGREFSDLQLSDILHDDDKIRDLAITGTSSHPNLIDFKEHSAVETCLVVDSPLPVLCPVEKPVHLGLIYWHAFAVSQRGVVFFRKQKLDIEEQKLLGTKLGELTGKPNTSKVWLLAFNSLGQRNVF